MLVSDARDLVANNTCGEIRSKNDRDCRLNRVTAFPVSVVMSEAQEGQSYGQGWHVHARLTELQFVDVA